MREFGGVVSGADERQRRRSLTGPGAIVGAVMISAVLLTASPVHASVGTDSSTSVEVLAGAVSADAVLTDPLNEGVVDEAGARQERQFIGVIAVVATPLLAGVLVLLRLRAARRRRAEIRRSEADAEPASTDRISRLTDA